MNSRSSKNVFPMKDLSPSNDLLDRPDLLWAAWERDGYLFFRDVLDKGEIGRVREEYARFLVENGLADPGDPACRYNRADAEGVPLSVYNDLNRRGAHRLIHESGPINAFFHNLLKEEPVWLPFTLHRTGLPTSGVRQELPFIHEDGSFNPGLDFLICWIPVDDIDVEVGGLALAEGLHNGPDLSEKEGESASGIRLEAVSADRWRTAHYRPGDVLLMHPFTPHSGITNVSGDRFRMSMDARLLAPGASKPIIGAIAGISSTKVVIEAPDRMHHLDISDKSYVRNEFGKKMSRSKITEKYPIGSEVIAVSSDNEIILLRYAL